MKILVDAETKQILGASLLGIGANAHGSCEPRLRKGRNAVDARGFIPVDDQLRTTVPGIWAMGDCNGRGAFTHTSYNDFEIVAANVLDNDPRRLTDRITAYNLYIDPPLGRAGMTEEDVRKSGKAVLMARRRSDPHPS
jgi:pyruvate/2-oxoglutarate dehydrogenase complex dihydrolipoamide dehydrogenase (E3) component